MRVAVVPGLYFKSYSRFTEARIPFETLALCGALESVAGVACRIVDFNLKGESVQIGDGAAVFPGHRLDGTFYDEAARTLLHQDAPVCFFNVSIHTNGNLFHSVKIAQALRAADSQALIVFCGLGPSSRHADLLAAYPHIDAVVRGEPEATAIDLMDRLVASGAEKSEHPSSALSFRARAMNLLATVEGVTYRTGSDVAVNDDRALVQSLDDLPMATSDYYGDIIRRASDQTADLRYLSVEEHIHLEAGRGCPFSCTFCSNTYLWRRRYRLKSPKRIVAEMRLYHERHGATKFLLHQQLFTVNKAKTRAFCEALIDANLPVEWSCFTRSDCLEPDLLDLMKRSGCNTVLIGVESGSQRIQDLIRKKTRIDEVAEHIDVVIAHGVKPQLSYIIGFPDETPEDLQATIDMYFKYKFAADVESQVGLLVPAGGTEILTQNQDDLDFDGVQTTTWYTRFLDDVSYAEMADLPMVYPHNHYVRTAHLDRALLLFIKAFDMAASYLNESCRYAIESGLLKMPFGAHEEYLTWRSSMPVEQGDAALWGGQLTWQTDVASVVVEFALFLRGKVAARDEEPAILADLVTYELWTAMMNLRLREHNWDEICAAAPVAPDGNPVEDAGQPITFTTTFGRQELVDYVRSGRDSHLRPTSGGVRAPLLVNTLAADGPSSLILTEQVDAQLRRTTFPVFRQIEF